MAYFKESQILVILYGLIIIALIPVIQFYFSIGIFHPEGKPSWLLFGIFSCGPLLVFLGVILVSFFQKTVHKILGSLSIIIGIIWLILLFKDVAAEQGIL